MATTLVNDLLIGGVLFLMYAFACLIFALALNRVFAPSSAEQDADADWRAYKAAKRDEGEWRE